jgi:error-prone DNA polymerase
VGFDQSPVDRVGPEQRIDVQVAGVASRPVEDQVLPAADPRQQLEPQQVREPEDRQRLALGICMDLGGLYVALFGADRIVVELIDQSLPTDSTRNRILAGLAGERGLAVVATNNVHYIVPSQHKLAAAIAAVRARRDLDSMDGWLPPAGTAFLRSGEEMAARFHRYAGAVARSVAIADQLAFDLRRAKPRLPLRDVPAGETPMLWLRQLTMKGAELRNGTRAERPDAYRRLERELDVIEDRNFPGYFLIVEDIVRFAHNQGILCQGRGSAAKVGSADVVDAGRG